MLNKRYSLQKRFLLNTSVLLVFFIAAMSVILLNTYATGIKQATHERLYAHFYGLLSAAELFEDELFLPEEPQLDQRFNQFASGLSAMVFDETETLVWKSISAEHDEVSLPNSLPGDATLAEQSISDKEYFKFHFVTEWESDKGDVYLFHFVLLENKRPFTQVINAYRNKLWLWLSGLGLSLLLILFLVLRFSFRPIRQMVIELNKVKQGQSDLLHGDYPSEIQQLTDSINRFIENERVQGQRHKETLANLAHSLKTPLAVMQAAIQNDGETQDLKKISSEQLQRMNQIVGYQLHRATSGPQVMMKKLELAPIVKKLADSLSKVYYDKGITISTTIDEQVLLAVNEGDLYEVCGNLLDNACKWAKSQVAISASTDNESVYIDIEDDGPGIPENVRVAVLSRGKRLDESTEGQGIGMSVVREILEAYNGAIEISSSKSLLGTHIQLKFQC